MNELLRLISLKQEGGYWDFKKEWYSKDSKNKLLHDIICMANNLTDKDGWIIIGIDEENNYCINDIEGDSNRKQTQNIVDFLKDIKFAGDIRPTVKVESVKFPNGTIDIIIVKNDVNTPYYLKERYQDVVANNIYTRIQDTNTPRNSSADIDKVEWLWKKRFGLLMTPLEKMKLYITHPEDWYNGPKGEMKKFHKFFPEFTIEYSYPEDERDGYTFYLFTQDDSRPHWKDIRLYYHQTLLMEIGGVSLDGGRYFTPCPESDGLEIEGNGKWDVHFKYMEKDSFLYKLNIFFYKHEWSHDAEISRYNLFDVVLLFENTKEREHFKDFAVKKWVDRNNYKSRIHVPYIPKIEGYITETFEKEYENSLILKEILKEYRHGKNVF